MGSFKTKFRKLWYIGLGAALALAPALTALADGDDGSSSERTGCPTPSPGASPISGPIHKSIRFRLAERRLTLGSLGRFFGETDQLGPTIPERMGGATSFDWMWWRRDSTASTT